MMDQMMIITFVLLNTFSILAVNGQLHCYVCKDCPNVDDLDETMSQPCNLISPPDTTTSTVITTTSTTIMTPPTTTATTPTPPSTPNTPPTSPPSSTVSPENDTLAFESIATKNDISNQTDENGDKNTGRSPRSIQISSGPPYRNIINGPSATERCFRIERIVSGEAKVVRGCVATADTTHRMCVQANDGVAPRSCRICHRDNCNAAKRNMLTSTVFIFTTIVSIILQR